MYTEPRVLSLRLYMPVAKMRPSGAWAKKRARFNPVAAMPMSKFAGSDSVMLLPGA